MKIFCLAAFALLSLTDIVAGAGAVSGGECTRQKENVVESLLGAFIPDCDKRGNFRPVQCHGSVCYCVDRVNGDRKDGTDVGVGEGRPDCDGPCRKERKGLMGNLLRGVDRPECDIDGNYKRMQCHASTGYCWCADSATGAKVAGSDVAPGNPRPQCGEIPSPHTLEFSMFNFNPTIKWNYSNETKHNNVTFDVEISNSFWMEWTETQCQKISERICDLISLLHLDNKDCPQYGLGGIYNVRVRACAVLEQDITQCSMWAKSLRTLEIPQSGKLSPPTFEVSASSSTQLLIINHPAVVKHANKSLNCYYDSALLYDIKYWGTNVSNQIEKNDVSFKTQLIPLQLCREPESNTELCVKMRVRHGLKIHLKSEWETKCILYKRVSGGECARQKENVVESLLGAFVPDCDRRGNFKRVQCHGAVCWCVDRVNGDRKHGTNVGVGEGRPDCDGYFRVFCAKIQKLKTLNIRG